MKSTMLKRLLSFVMVLAMVTSYVVMPAAAETADSELGHTHTHVAGEPVAPTCTADGYTTYVCGCGDRYTADVVTAAGHSYENGICSACGEVDPNYVAPLNEECDHVWDDGVTTAATCTASGSTVYTCTVEDCGETKTDTIDATGHNFEEGVCTLCGDPDPDSVPTCEHVWGEGVTTAATCTASGSTVYTCTVEGCGETKADTIDATGHNFEEGVCTLCGDPDPDSVPTCEHVWGEGVTTDATCTASGSTVYACTVEGCGETMTDTIDATGHTYENGICTACGEAEPVCSCTVRCAETVNADCPVCSVEGGICAVEEKEEAPEMPAALYFSDQDKTWGEEVTIVYVDAEGNETRQTMLWAERGYFYASEVPAGTVSFYFTDGVNNTQPQSIETVLTEGWDMCVIFDGETEWMEYAIWEQMVPPTDNNTIDLVSAVGSITAAGEYIVTGENATNSLTIAPGADAEVTVTLSNVFVTAASGSAISIESGNVTLILEGSNTLTGATNGAGIYVAEDASVTIQGNGSLTAVGNAGSDATGGAAGIGGTATSGNSGAITIDGATVVAKGYGVHGSGIGSGSGQVVGEIKITNGANVTAQGGYYSVGGTLPEGDNYGTALPEGGAAIGGGGKTASTVAAITITDSTVVANGGSKAAGIGANFWCSVQKITINGASNVTANGGVSSAGIGTSRAGDNGVSVDIEIGGTSVVNATGGYHGAGIGGGYNGDSLSNLPATTITIKDSAKVTAAGQNGGAGIGGGYKTNNLNITISDTADVTATASVLNDGSGKTIDQTCACGIGSGANGSGTFNGSTISIANTAKVIVNTREGGKDPIEGMSAYGANITVNGATVSAAVAQIGSFTYASLPKAVEAANAMEGGATIELLKDVTLGEKLTISNNVTISGEHTITRGKTTDDEWYTGTLFDVNSGATLTLDGGLTIDGANEWSMDMNAYKSDLAELTQVSDGNKYFTPEEGAPVANAYMITTSGTVNLKNVTIQNNYSTNSGIVSASTGSTVNLEGAQIKHNAATQASGVVVNASAGVYESAAEKITVNMNSGTVIDGNHVGGNHGIFKIYLGTTFNMNGGSIKNTTGWNSNGVAVGVYWATFNMNGGEICSNSSVYGPNNGRNAPVYLHSAHIFEMSDGSICHNRGGSRSGLDAPYADSTSNGTATITGGYIGENSSYYNENGEEGYEADITAGDKLFISGGTFTQDVNKWCTEDYHAVQNEEGEWEVVKLPDIAENTTTGKKYTSLQKALNEAVDGQIVKLLASLSYDADDIVYAHGGGTGFGTYDQDNPCIIYTGGTKGADGAANQASTVNAILDLNSHSITSSADAYLFVLMDNTKLTFTDSIGGGGITNTSKMPVIWAVGTDTQVTIDRGTYTTANDEGLLWSTHGADMEINGGEFKTTAEDSSLLIVRNEQDLNNPGNFVDGNATITVNGGTFHGFNPENIPDDATTPFTYFNGVSEGKCAADNNGAFTVGVNKMSELISESNADCFKPAMKAHYVCEYCGRTYEENQHKLEADDVTVGDPLCHEFTGDRDYDEENGAAGHYQWCIRDCGTKSELENHRWSEWERANTRSTVQETRYCLDCGYLDDPRSVHVHDYIIGGYTEASHELICNDTNCNKDADAKKTVNHDLTIDSNNDGQLDKCICGYSTAKHVHNLVWKHNSSKHWQECTSKDGLTCDHKEVKENHVWGSWEKGKADGSSKASWCHKECKTCGYIIERHVIWSYSDNPKTGDYIAIAFGVMFISAAALVTLLVFKKKRR